MALDNFRKINITLNKANQHILEPQIAKVGDVNGRELVVQLIDEGVIKDQTGVSLTLNWQHANGNKGTDGFTALDDKQGIFSVFYPENMLHRGTVKANISINESGKITNSLNFQINVQGDVFDGSAVEVDGLLFDLKDLKSQIDERKNSLEILENRQSSIETQFDSLEQELTNKDVISAPEIIAARDGRETLSERLSEDFAKANSSFRHDEYSDGMYSWWVYPLSVYENYSTYFGTIDNVGVVHLNVFDHVSRKFDRAEIYQSEVDDHNAPSVNILKDGRIAVIYARHGQEKQVRFRITEKPYDIHTLGAEKTLATPTVISYIQSYVDDNDRIHIFTRRQSTGWLYLRTDDEGDSWTINRRLTWIGEGRTELFYMKIKPTRLADNTEVIRMIFTIHPELAINEQDIYYAALNVKTGNVFIPSTSIGNAYDAGFGSIVELSSLQKVYTPASGKRTRIYDVSTGELSVLFLEFTTKADAVYKLSKWNGSGFTTYTLTAPGVPIGSSVSYFGGAMFSDYADNEVLLSREDKGVWTIERWNLNKNNQWETDIISQSNGEKIFRPITPLGNSGNIMYVKGEYAAGSYTDYDTNVVVLHSPESDGKFSTKDTQVVEVVTPPTTPTPTPTTDNVFKSSSTYERINITDTATKSGSISVVFDEPFSSKPVVVAQSLHVAFNVSLSNITASGFDITVRNVLNDLDYPIVDVNWIALSK